MKQIIRRAVLALALIGLAPATAQQFPTVPGQSVIGRLGLPSVSGPSQAIPMATLQGIIKGANITTPETYGAPHDGVHDDGPAFEAAVTALSATRGTLQLSCGTTYTISTVSSNALSLIRAVSGVNIIGCGPSSSIIRMANNVNTSSSFFARVIGNTGAVNDVIYADFTIDMNGTNNSCSSTCFAFNAAIQIGAGDNITVRGVKFINNPGSNNINIASGAGIVPTTVKLIGNVHEHNGDVVNAASADFSDDFVIAANIVVADNIYSDGARVNGSAFELHGANITASNLVVSDHFNCGIIANETFSATTNNINLGNYACSNVKSGLQVYSRAAATNTNINIHDGTIEYLAGAAGIGIDACTVISATTGSNINLRIAGNQIKSAVTTTLGTDAPAICVGRWLSALIIGNQTYNTQGEGIYFSDIADTANIGVYGNQITGAGRTANAAHQFGIQVNATGGTTASAIHIQSNNVTGGGVVSAVKGAENATIGAIFGNLCSGCGGAPVSWSGTGTFVYTSPAATMTFAGTDVAETFTALQRFNDNDFALVGSTSGTLVQRAAAVAGSSVIRWPAGSTDFSATGGSGQVVKQGSVGAALTVGGVAVTDLSAAGTGVLTALGINVGTAGSIVVNGGALGIPSSGTLTNATGLPIAGLTGAGTGVLTALAANVGVAGAVVVQAGQLGTPSAGIMTNTTSATSAVDTSNTNLATNAFVIGQAASATPLADTTAGAVGTSTRFARADHSHPAANVYSQITFAAGNMNPMLQASTWFFTTGPAAAAEGVVGIPVSQAVTFDKMYCSSQAVPAVGQTFTITMRKAVADQSVTCQITNAATTCNDTTHSFSAVAGDLLSVKLVTSATSGTANGMSCGLRATVSAP